MHISYTHYVFQTLTYSRESGCRHQRWWNVSKDVTAYIQKIRRLFKSSGRIEFLRVIEHHSDWNPHVHLLLWFESSLTVERERYFSGQFFRTLQLAWIRGHSKPEVLRSKDDAFAYTLKYFLKQLSPKTKEDTVADSVIESLGTELPPKVWPLKGKRVVRFAMPIRLLAWSRGMQALYQEQQRRKLNLPQDAKILVSRAVGKQTQLDRC